MTLEKAISALVYFLTINGPSRMKLEVSELEKA
jgi:hypothetical protein